MYQSRGLFLVAASNQLTIKEMIEYARQNFALAQDQQNKGAAAASLLAEANILRERAGVEHEELFGVSAAEFERQYRKHAAISLGELFVLAQDGSLAPHQREMLKRDFVAFERSREINGIMGASAAELGLTQSQFMETREWFVQYPEEGALNVDAPTSDLA